MGAGRVRGGAEQTAYKGGSDKAKGRRSAGGSAAGQPPREQSAKGGKASRTEVYPIIQYHNDGRGGTAAGAPTRRRRRST